MLSVTAQLLYFHMGMIADDDGFADCYSLVRSIEITGSEFDELTKNGYIIPVPGRPYVCYICDWLESNNIRKERYRESIYHDLIPELQKKKMDTERNRIVQFG